MNCKDFESQFSRFIEGDLALEVRDSLRFHIRGCNACREKLNDMKNTMRAVRSIEAETPSVGFDVSLKSRLNAEITSEIYGRSIWVRMKEASSAFVDFGRQGAVQAVFSASLVLTVGVGLTLPYLGSPDSDLTVAQGLFLPEPAEPDLALTQLTAPLPFDNAELAPPMVAVNRLDYAVGSTTSPGQDQSFARIIPVFDFDTLLPLPSGELRLAGGRSSSGGPVQVSSGSGGGNLLLGTFSNQPTSLLSGFSESSRSTVRSGQTFGIRDWDQRLVHPGARRYILPAVPSKKRITRVSF